MAGQALKNCAKMMASAMKRHPRLLSALSSSSHFFVASGSPRLPRLCHGEKPGYNISLGFCNQDGFHFQRSVASSSKDRRVCQLFHEIASRTEAVDRHRRASLGPPSSTMERKSAASVTSEFCNMYLSFPDWHPSSEKCPKRDILELLLRDEYGVNEESITSTIDNIRSRPLRDADILRIRGLCTPRYEFIFHYILGSAPQDLGVAFLVSLRRNASEVIHYWKFIQRDEVQDDEDIQQNNHGQMTSLRLTRLQTVERSIKTILTSLFRPGVLQLQRITYEKTPASIIERIAFKEAVHPLQSLQDLRIRLGPGRRCFAFFHPALPDIPLVFVHVALLHKIPKSMEDLQSASGDSESNATCAAFYSISNSEQGLTGVDLGNHLIKSVVQVLQGDFPTLHTFCTLSPIPKFRLWLEGKLARHHEGLLRLQERNHGSDNERSDGALEFVGDGFLTRAEYEELRGIFSSESHPLHPLDNAVAHGNGTGNERIDVALFNRLQPLLMKLAAYYLTVETHHGRPICPVAKFHVRNGAEMYRLNFMADRSKKGLRSSCGMMINYRYQLDEIEENNVRYEINGDVPVKDGVKCWLRGHALS